MSIEKELSKIYISPQASIQAVDSNHSITIQKIFSTILTKLSTEIPTDLTKPPITIPANSTNPPTTTTFAITFEPTTILSSYLSTSPLLTVNTFVVKFDSWFIFLITAIAILLFLIVVSIFYCFWRFCCRRSLNTINIQSPDISKNDEPVDGEVKIFNRKSAAETIYLTVPSTVQSIPEISEDLTFSDVDDISESSHLRRNNTFTILD